MRDGLMSKIKIETRVCSLGIEVRGKFALSSVMRMDHLKFPFRPSDLLPHFGQLFFRGVCLPQLLLFSKKVLHPILQMPYFLVDAGFAAPLGLQIQPFSGFQQFG